MVQQETSQHLPVLYPAPKTTKPRLCSCKTQHLQLLPLFPFHSNIPDFRIRNSPFHKSSSINRWQNSESGTEGAFLLNPALHCGFPIPPGSGNRCVEDGSLWKSIGNVRAVAASRGRSEQGPAIPIFIQLSYQNSSLLHGYPEFQGQTREKKVYPENSLK